MQGTAGHHVGGGDRTVPLHVPYSTPRTKPRGLDWSTIHPQTAPAAQEAAMSFDPPQTCVNCEDDVHSLSSRDWCDFCEAEAARDTAPLEPTPQTEPVVASLVLPDYALHLAGLLADTEGHPDPLVRATRKIVTQAAVALQQAVKATQTSVPDTASADHIPAESTSVPAPSGSEPTAAEYRAWAARNGHEVAANGRVPKYIKELYATAHQDAA